MSSVVAVHFLDVGQAHAAVATDSRSALVVDCPKSGARAASERISGVGQLDVIVTHRDLDHCGGIAEILREGACESTRLFINAGMAVSSDSRDHPRVKAVIRSILGAIDEAGASCEHALRGRSGNTGAFSWTVLAPTHEQVLATAIGGSINRSSVVVRLQFENTRFLIPGDVDDSAVDMLLENPSELAAEVLLMPHHGAKMKRLDELLKAVDPQHVVISSGRSMSHPAIDTLRIVAAHSCRLMCTEVSPHCHDQELEAADCAGSISFTFPEGSVQVNPDFETHLARIDGWDSPKCIVDLPGR